MRLIIVGSKGFIGKKVFDYFTSIGNQTYGCDVVVDYNSQQYFQVEATSSDFQEIFQSTQFDACINCAGAASVPDSFAHPSRDFHLNVQLVYSILESIRKFNPGCKFINLSSAAIYGNPSRLPVVEVDSNSPISPYGWHKLYAEQVCREFATYFNVPTAFLRIFSAYGPGLRKQLFWDVYQKLKQSSNLQLLGSGMESRDFIFVEDIARAIDTLLSHGEFKGAAYNLASGQETTIREAVSVFCNLYRPDAKVEFTSKARPGDPVNWCADISKLKGIGFQPSVKLEDGLKQYVQWLRVEKE
jgi:UDP-glucose 4-epimerase